MKLNKNFIARDIAGELVIVPLDDSVDNGTGLISTNEVGALIWKCLEQGKTLSEITSSIVEEFEVDENTAGTDAAAFIDELIRIGAIIEQ